MKTVQHEIFLRNTMQKNFTLHCKLRKMFLQNFISSRDGPEDSTEAR